MIDNSTIDKLLALSTADRLAVAEALWESLASMPSAVPMPDWHHEVIAQRFDEDELDQVPGEDWATVRRRIENRG